MTDSAEQKLFPVIPPQESKCVWMTAGILSYQLCDREFECEQCPLDIALRQRFKYREATPGDDRNPAPAKEAEESRVGVLFGRKHLWMKREGEGRVRLGIEPGLASVLVSPKAVVLPTMGEHVVRNKACSWIVLDEGTLPMISPISGQVIATNNLLVESPHAVCASPLGEGWLFELSVNSADIDDADVLLTADVARVYANDERRLKTLLSAEMKNGESKDAQNQTDLRQAITRLSETLGPNEYLKLLRSIYT